MSADPATAGEAARAAWGDCWAKAPEHGRGKPGWDSIAYEKTCWEAAADAARAFPVKPDASPR